MKPLTGWIVIAFFILRRWKLTKNEVVPVNCRKVPWWPPSSMLDIVTAVTEEEEYNAFIELRNLMQERPHE